MYYINDILLTAQNNSLWWLTIFFCLCNAGLGKGNFGVLLCAHSTHRSDVCTLNFKAGRSRFVVYSIENIITPTRCEFPCCLCVFLNFLQVFRLVSFRVFVAHLQHTPFCGLRAKFQIRSRFVVYSIEDSIAPT